MLQFGQSCFDNHTIPILTRSYFWSLVRMKVCPNPSCQQPVPDGALFCPACGHSLQAPSDESGANLAGRVLNQKYRLISQIAEGGMALVYKAEHIFLDDLCAVKIIKKGLSSKEEMLKRFQREAKLTRQVSRRSPYIIAIYDFGVEDELGFYYVMELLDGYPFTELLQNPNEVPDPIRSVRLTCQICEALAVVHEEGLVHRDIKPDNIFLHRDDNRDEEIVKLLDFGIARPTYAKATMLTNYGRVMGTPEYMSPEQCRGPTPQQYERGESHLDGRSDIYSLGVLLYQCLTGDVPFPMPTDGGPMAIHKVMAGHVMEEATPPVEKSPQHNIPPALSEVTLRAMAKSPDDRFQTMLEFRDALLAIYPELQAEFRGSGVETSGQMETLPMEDIASAAPVPEPLSVPMATPSPAAVPQTPAPDAGVSLLTGLDANLDRTAIDVQLTPELLAEANRWAQQHNQQAPSSQQSEQSGDIITSEVAEPDWSKEPRVDPGTALPRPMDELAKTVTSPLDPNVMEELRERARQVAHEGPVVATPRRPLAQIKPGQGGSFQPKISGAAKKPEPSSGKKRSPLVLVLAIGFPLLLIVGLLIFRFVLR